MIARSEAQLALDQQKYRKAYKLLRSLPLDEENEAATLEALATCLFHLKRDDEAFEKASDALALQPDLEHARVILAYLYAAKREFPSSRVELNKALALAPNMVDAIVLDGILLVQEGNLTDGIVALEAAIRLDPSSWRAHANLGYAHFREKQFRESKREYREAFRLNPSAKTLAMLIGVYSTAHRPWVIAAAVLITLVGLRLGLFWLPAAVIGSGISYGFLRVLAGEGRRGWATTLWGLLILLLYLFLVYR